MKKVLIIGHFWPYRDGSHRIFGLARNLTDFGWEPIVITGPLLRKPEIDVRYVSKEYRNFVGMRSDKSFSDSMREKSAKMPAVFKKVGKFLFINFAKAFAYPDEHKNWEKSAIEAAEEIIKKEKINAIISTWPVTSHLAAKKIKIKHNIFWIADFPDPWSQNHNYTYGKIRRYFDKILELKTISSADIITAAAPLYKKRQETLHKKPAILISHGFEIDDFNALPVTLTKKFTVTYTGNIYRGKQDPLKILDVLKDLIADNAVDSNDIEIRFFGKYHDWLETEIKKRGLKKIAKQYGEVLNKVSFGKQKESQILLILNWEEEKGVYPSKIFSYLAAKRPIFAVGGFTDDDVKEIIDETSAGIYACRQKDIKARFLDFYNEYKQKGRVDFRGDLKKISKYSQREMAKKFVEIINKI